MELQFNIRLPRRIARLIDRYCSCDGKVRYGHKETADKAAQHMRRRYGEAYESYRCRYCQAWHVGHKSED